VIDEIAGFSKSGRLDTLGPEYMAKFLSARGRAALGSIRRLSPRSKALRARVRTEERALIRSVKSEMGLIRGKVRRGAGGLMSAKLGKHAGSVYRRTLPGPVDTGALLMELSPRWKARHRRWLAKEKGAYVVQPMALYWMDGRRASEEICRLISAETGSCNPEFLGFYFDLLKEVGAIEPT
jgi:hypothetical protein